MSKLMTYEEFMKRQHTKTTAPLDMKVFAGMLDNKPLSFKDGQTTYDIPLAPDVKMVFEGMVKLIADNVKKPDKPSKQELLAYEYATRVSQSENKDKPDKEVTKNGD